MRISDWSSDGCSSDLEQPTRYVDRDAAAECGVAAVDQGAASASLTKAEILVMQDFGRGEAVMKFDEVEVGDVDPRSLIDLQGGGARDLVEISQPVFEIGRASVREKVGQYG